MSTSVTVIGNLTRNPRLSRTGDDARRLLDLESLDTTCWQVCCFGAQAEHVIASLHRGARAIAVGDVRTHTWSSAKGDDRYLYLSLSSPYLDGPEQASRRGSTAERATAVRPARAR